MSKTYLNQVEKVKMFVNGLQSHYDMVKELGISQEQLENMKRMSSDAETLNDEVERLRQEASLKMKEANAKLSDLKEMWLPIKNKVKSKFSPLQWPSLGIQDKR